MISLCCAGMCGEEDFSRARLKKGRLSSVMAGSRQVEKSRYGLDMGGFWLCGKCRIIADNHSPIIPNTTTSGNIRINLQQIEIIYNLTCHPKPQTKGLDSSLRSE